MTVNNDREIREAIAAADDALFHLGNAQQYLRSARNWGIYDILGGGFISTMIKHSKMDRAGSEMEAARDAVCRFSRELQDVAGSARFELDTDDFLTFADYFFDGFLADFMVQSRIGRAREQTDIAIRRISSLREQLVRELRG